MFSSKFLSGANPLNAVSSAVNKFGLFGDDGEGEKKSSPQQGARPPGEQQKGAGPGKDPQQQQGPQKSGQALPMQKTQPAPKQGPPQLQGNGQTGPSNKQAGPQAASKAGAQPDAQVRGEPPKNQPKGSPQQGSPKPGAQQQISTKSGAQPGSPKAPTQQESPNTRRQQPGAVNAGAQKQEQTRTGAQGSPKVGQQQQQQQQQKGVGTPTQQQASDQRGPVQIGMKEPGASGVSPVGSSSPGATKAGSQSKTLCPVCKTTTLNVHTKEPPNHKTCTQCKTQVCSLCGFSPPDSDGREWLCLTCQIQRAQGTSEASGPPMMKPSPNKTSAPPNQTSSPAGPSKKEISAPGSSQKMPPAAAKVPAKGEVAKGQESQKQGSPAPVQKVTPVTQSGSPKPNQASQPGRKQSSATPAPQQDSGGFFGFGGAKTEAAKPEETVTGKMFGFGSSIFSSASTLISSAGQDEPKATPPVSPKIQAAKDTRPSPKLPRSEQPQPTKVPPTGPAKVEKSNCPICKMVLNTGSKDPPNYSTCTECKCTVCNQCGFNPMPNVKEGKEWLCLNCQVKRAAGGAEPQGDPSLVNSIKKPMPTQPSPQKTSAPGSPQKKQSTPATQPAKAEAPDSHKKITPAPGPQGSQKTGPPKQPEQSGPKQESGGFFGFGGPKTQPDASKPAESVTGKMFGLGSSFLSSASTLISSTADESKATPPVSPKMSPAKDSKSPPVKKPEQEKKVEQPQQVKGPPSGVTKTDKPPSEQSKTPSALSVGSKPGQSTCPLCKLELNVGSKDPPNYNTCTGCKNTVCNQCGFNPMPNVKEVKEWLCLNCQMQRALGAAEPPGTPLMKQQASPNKANIPAKKEAPPLDKPQVKNIPTPAESKTKDPSPSGSPVRKPQKSPLAEPAAKTEAKKGPESQTQASPAPSQKTPQQDQKTTTQRPPGQTSQHAPKKGSVSSTQEESGGFFGFGGPKSQPDAAKPAESLGGKMFGFGSSLLSSASTLMNTAGQDESKTTPPVSPKMPAAKESKSPTAPKKTEPVQEQKTRPSSQAKVEKGVPEPSKDAAAVPKGAPATCPLCKIQLNLGSKEPPNYNKCTECKNTVCNQCGFSPMPNVSEAKEWLCLNCQMQRALSTAELTAPPMKPQTAANKISPIAVHQKAAAPNQAVASKKDLKSDDTSKAEAPGPNALQQKGGATTASPQKTPPAPKAAKGPESQTQASPTPGQKTPKDIQAASGPQERRGPEGQLGQSKVTPNTQEPGKQAASPAPKPGPEPAKTTESIGGKMFGFGSSIFSSASTLISSAVQEESRTTPPGSRKMSAPAQASPKMSVAPKVSPKTTPSASPNMSPAREPKAQKSEQEKKSAESQKGKEDKVEPQVPKVAPVSQMASPAPGQKTPADARAAPGPQKQSDQASQPGQSKVASDTQESVKQPASPAPKPGPEPAKTTESIGGKMFGFGSSIFSSASTLITSAVQEESRTTPPGSRKMSAPAQVSPKMSVAPKVSPKTTPSVSPNMSPAREAKNQKPEQEKKSVEPQQITGDKTQPQLPKVATVSQEAGPAPDKTPPGTQGAPGPQKQSDQASQPGQKKVASDTQESGKQPASPAPKPGPEPAKTTESIGGKMFGFGSSIFSSASTLITSAVQEESRTTPPGSRKMSAPAQASPKMSAAPKVSPKATPTVSPKMSPAREPKAQKPEQEKKSAEQIKDDKTQPVGSKAPPVSPKVEQTACPLCKVELNINSKLPPNYNTCTECKTVVCNQCGFNPMPVGEVKEWLCLNCQMKRAVEAAGPPGPPMLKSQVSPKKVSTPAAVQLPEASKPTTVKESPAAEKKPSEPIPPQGKQTTPSAQSSKPEASTAPLKQAGPKPDRSPQEKQKAATEKQPDNANQPGRKPSNASAATQQESGGFFGFGSSKTQPDAEKTTEKVAGKMFGFGSSIFSSASTLITSAVQDQPKTTPPVSPKLSPAKDSRAPAVTKTEQDKKPEPPQQAKGPPPLQQKADETKTSAPQKLEQEKKAQLPQQTKTPPSGQDKVDKAPSEPPHPSQAAVKPDQSTCPLCKVKLNMGTKEQPNYNTCTECKNTVCNQCGFNPMPNETKVKEWLCLNCQMQRALGEAPPPGVPSVTPQTKPQARDPSPAEAGKKPSSAPHSPQRKASVTPQPAASEAVNKPAAPKQAIPVPSQKMPQEPQKTEAPIKSPVQPRPTERKQSNAAAATQKDSGGFFGFGSGKTQPEAEKPPESVSGKMFGFGSSIFSSASTLISSTVQDQPKTTPPVSPKMAPAKEVKSPAAQVKGKPEQPQPTKTPPVQQAKVDKAPPEPSKAAGAPQAPVKPSPSTCPLCKVELNKGSKDPPNYNACTECKNTVCNQCGFNPMPNESEMKEWLCLTCQMQRALKASESIQPPLMKAQASPSKVLTAPPTDKEAIANQKKDAIPTQKDEAPSKTRESPAPPKKVEVAPSGTAPAKDVPRATPAPAKDKGPSPPAEEVPASAAAPSKGKEAVASDIRAPQPAPAAPVAADPDTSVKQVSEKKAEKVEKSVDQPGKASDEAQPQQAASKEPVEAALPKTASPAAEPSNQESGGFFGFGSPKSQRAASKATEAVTGKVRGFGSSLFSSASTLISSAVQEETVPSTRKMSAPLVSGKTSELQLSPKSSPPISPKKPVPSGRKMSAPLVAGKPSELQVSPKSSPPVSPKREKEKEVKPDADQKTVAEKTTGQPAQAKAPPSEETSAEKGAAPPEESKVPKAALKAVQSTCPLCKVELNLDSKNPPNYNTCTECKATVCSKCGFSPMPNVTEVKEWLCLNCQMQRALGASEPPGLPMMKLQPSPSKEVPATAEKKETAVPTPQENTSKIDALKKEPVTAAGAKEPDLPAISAPTEKVAPVDVSLPNKTKTEVPPAPPKPSVEKASAQRGAPQQQVQASPKPAPPQDAAKEKPAAQQPPKAVASPAKPAAPPVQPAKQESGGFFGFGAPKTPPTAAKSTESVTGKMFGFGSSFLSSASTLITSAVQDESKDTPPTPRKMSVTSSVTPKTTPPVSPKMTPAKDTKPPVAPKSEPPQQQKPTPPSPAKADRVPSELQKQTPPAKTQPTQDTPPPAVEKPEEKKAERPPQERTPSAVAKAPAEPTKKPAETPAASKADRSICPLCKIKLNLGSTDPANYNTCTECKTTVCNQCGFNPMPNETEVKEWLCLNCQMQRALGASEPAVPAGVKPQPSPSKVSTQSAQEKPKETDVKKEVTKTTETKEEPIKPKGPVPTAAQKVEAPQQKATISGAEQGKAQDVPGKPPAEKPTPVPAPQTAKTEVKPQQPAKSVAQPPKPAPAPSQPAKQESGGFFGFGAPKTPPTAVKSAESVKGKMFGFGSSFLSSASTLITSAVQDEPKSTPPTPRKMSTSGSVSPKITPPVSPKMAPAKDAKPPVAQKPEPPQQVKAASPAPAKTEKAPAQLPQSTEGIKVAPKPGLTTCPLCKVELNVGSKDPPNYNTCTECKNTVCNLCGFNPMPHTEAKEWLCLNCQTQRALSGQLGDPGKMPQPVSNKPETQVAPASKKTEPKSAPAKAEPTPMATKTQPVAATVEAVPTVPTSKAKVETASVKREAVATAVSTQIDTTPKPTAAKVLPVEAGPKPLAATTAEPSLPTPALMQKAEIMQKPEALIAQVSKTETIEKKEVKMDIAVKESPKPPVSKPDIQQEKVVESAPTAPSLPVTKVPVVPASTAVEASKAVTESEQELGVPEKTMKDDKMTKPTQALQQDQVEPKQQEQLVKEIKQVVPADSKELAEKPVGKITAIPSVPESQPVSTQIQDQDENMDKFVKKRKVSLPTGQDTVATVTTTGPPARQEEDLEDQPQILPILQEPSDGQPSDASKIDTSKDSSMPVKAEVKTDRRRLSFQPMEESSGSELTPSPSPKVQRRRLKVSKISSSSEDIKTESADSSIEDDDFIRKQIMGMGDEEEMSLSDDEKEKNLEKAEEVMGVDLDNAPVTTKPQDEKGSADNEERAATNVAISKTETAMTENVPETIPKTTFKKALPVLRQRQSTDEDVDSITESLSKGSSSVQASSFTPESAHTSASSLEEDSDSSPSHRKVSRDKQHRKGKHRQPTQPLPTIEDSSDEERMRAHGQPLSPPGGASSPEDLREVTVIAESHRTSGSEYSASVESEPEIKRAVQRGRKPSPTVIPYSPSDTIKEDTFTKPLKSAEEAYEEIIQKTKAIPGESPPDIEPLYGGMAIEDYLYESLVEEPDFKLIGSQAEEPRKDSGSESTKKLRSPEEVYEEMMQKKRELMMIEHEFQQAQTAMESSSSGVTGPPSIPETCVVAMPLEETAVTGQTEMPPTSTETYGEGQVKKKKRPAPPRPSEPPKRTEGGVMAFTPTGSIGFVRPMVPQDPALRKALFPIPDLKITQCSSGEEEEDSLADEYGMGMSSDITPSDDSETKEDPSISPPLSETIDMEPIAVICEIPEPKPIPTPISAPELTTTPSPVSPVSPPTSPATPDSSLASNATSSSSFQAQTPPSLDSTPMSTPTPTTSYKGPPPKEVSAPAASVAVPVASPTPAPVIVTIPDVVSDPSKAETPPVAQVVVPKAEAQTPLQVEVPTAVPCVVQMPDLVSSPSQEPITPASVLQVSAPGPAPIVVSARSAAPVTAQTVSVTTTASAALPPCPGPVVVQMPDLVSTAAPISAQVPAQVSALVTTPAETQAKVVPSGPAIPSVSPEIIRAPVQTAQMTTPAPASTTIVKKKVPPPPPPRSTSVSLPESTPELPSEKTPQQTIVKQATVARQPMQSVVVDIQPRMEEMLSDESVPQVVTQTRQGHVVIIVPSAEKSRQATPSPPHSTQTAEHPPTDKPQVAPAPPLPTKPTPVAEAKDLHADKIPAADQTPLPPPSSPKPTAYAKPLVSGAVVPATDKVTPVPGAASSPSQTTKPPPPIPPKPISIPAGLVFSHKPGESVKPPPPPVAPKAATLPRTKEPPNALSLSITRPVESKLGTTSPKSPLSPRYAKCLQTYVVITLPSEPGSPTEAITVQAPLRRGSIPSTKVSGVRTTPSEQKTPTEGFSAQASVRRASVPSVRHPPPTAVAPTVMVEQVAPSVVVSTKGQITIEPVPSLAQKQLPVADVTAVSSQQDTSIQLHTVPPPLKKPFVPQQQPITQQEQPPPPMSETITIPREPEIVIQPQTVQATARPQPLPSAPLPSHTPTEVPAVYPEGPDEVLVSAAPMPTEHLPPVALTEVVTVPPQPQVSSDAPILQDRPAVVHSTVIYPQVPTEFETVGKDYVEAHDVTVKEDVQSRSPIPQVSPQIDSHEQLNRYAAVTDSKEQVTAGLNNTQIASELSPVTQIIQPSYSPAFMTEQISSYQPPVTEAAAIPSNAYFPSEVIIIDNLQPEVPPVFQLPYRQPVVAEVTPSPEIATRMTPSIADAPLDTHQMAMYTSVAPAPYVQQDYRAIPSSVIYSMPPIETIAMQPGFGTPMEIVAKDDDGKGTSVTSSEMQPQGVVGIPVITNEATTSRRRTSISSIVQPPYNTSEICTYPADYKVPSQVVTTEEFSTTRRESISMQQPISLGQVVNMPAERDVPIDGYVLQDPYRRGSIPSTEQQPKVLTYSSEYDRPLEIITTEAYTRRTSIPTVQEIPQGVPVAPVTITQIQQESIESQEIRGPEKVVSSMSHMYSSSISTSGQPPESLPRRVTQVVTTEVQRTTVSVVHERLPQVPSPSVAITIQPDVAKVQPLQKQNGKIIYPGDVMDLRTMKMGIKMTDQGMDLTPPESCRQSFSSDSSGRQITAVQPEIVNLSPEITPATTLSVVTDSITIVTCTATIASYKNTPAEKPLDLQGPVTSSPLPLTTYKQFEPLAQIVYRPVNTQPKISALASSAQDIPINLSFEALVSAERKQPMSPAPVISNGGPVLSLETTGAMDLSNYRPMTAMVALSGTSPGVVTTVVEDDGTPVDLTAGRRSVCCDVIYKLPFTGSCRTQPPVTNQPDSSFGHRDDLYQYDEARLRETKGTDGLQASVSNTNLTDAGLFSSDPKNDYNYLSGPSDAAIDLTAAKLSAGNALDYTSKATGVYPGMTPTSPYSQVAPAGFGVNSALRTSNGIVYSSVAAPVPSTYAITTQPGSILSTTITPTSTIQNQSLPHPYGFIPTTDPGQLIPFDAGIPKELLPTALADIITGYPEMYSDTTLEAIAASLDALASSPIFPGLDNAKMAQYQMEREFLELEKLKQLCLAEELEWERQEIQRYREQEQLMVQRELEELQALKQQLLLQQEEEHHAHMVAQQETYAQQKEQLQQIQHLQLQLQRQLDEHYGSTGTTGNLLDAKYAGVGDSGQYWPVKDESTTPTVGTHTEGGQDHLNLVNKLQADQDFGKKIIDSGVQTDDEDSAEKQNVGRRKKSRRNTDSSAQTDDEDQDEWDAPTKARRRSRKHSSEGKHGSKVSSIAIQTVAEISVQTDHSGTIKRPNVQMDTKVEIIKHISAPENSQRGGSLSCQTDSDRRLVPIEVGYSTHLTAEVPSKGKIFYTAVSPLSPEKSHGGQRMLTADPTRFSSGPRALKSGQKSLSDPKSLSPSTEDRMGGYYADSYSGRGSPSGTGKKVKRTLPDPPPEDDGLAGRAGYSTGSARRRLARSTTMARAKILQDIDKELDLVERESSKLRKKQAELDEEEKEIDAKLRYLEMGINRRKEALLKEREKRERAYLQGVAEERDYMSDSEVSNIREARGDGLERPRTAPQSEFDQFIPPQTEADSQYNTLTSPYSHYAQYVPQTQTTSHYTQQNLYQQQSLYHQQVSPYPTLSLSHGQTQSGSYQHALLLQQGKQRQTTLSDLEPKITTNYEVIRNQPLLIVPTSSESGYGVAHLGGKYGSLDLRLGLEERSMASSPMSSISADSFYADIDHHNARNYVLIEDIGELTKASTGLSNTSLGSGFSLPDKELSKADRLLRAAEVRRTAEVAEFLGSSRLQGYGKGEDDTMEEPYELKLLKQQIKQEFRRGTEGLEQLTGLGLPQYIHSDSSLRHFPKGEKYSIGRLTLEKQAAKQLPAAMIYQKQMKNKKALIDPKAITKFSPIQESRDLEPEFGSYMGSGASSVSSLAARARLLQDEITFGLRKNLSEQQKYLGSSLGANLSGSLNLGQSLALGSTIRATAHDDGTYPSGTRSRPSSRPSSVYGLDLSIKRDLSSSSLRLKTEGDVLDAAFAPGVARAKPTSLPISQSRGRIPIVAQNSEEESPLSPVGQPMGMARASAGPLPPISADSRDQFGSSHSLPEVQQHMREESRTRGYDRDIAFIMDDLQGAMSDSEAGGPNWNIEAYHLRREDTDWFDKPREGHPQGGNMDRRQMKLVPYAFPHTHIKLKRDINDSSVSGNGLGIRVVGGKEIPGSRGEIGAYIAKVTPGGVAEQTGKVVEGMQVLEWNGVPLTGKTYEEVQCIMAQPCAEAEICVRLDLNMLSDPEHPQALEHHIQLKAGGQRSPGVDPKQLAAELQKVSQQQAPGMAGVGPGGLGVLSALERSALLHSGTGSAASSGVPSPGQPASPAINKKQRHKTSELMRTPHPITGEIQLQINYDRNLGNLIVHVLQARNLAPRDNDGYSDPFVKVYLLPGRGQVMVVQNASADNKRRTKYAQRTLNPEWNQTVIYKNIHLEQLKKKTLEVTVWDYDRSSSNDFLGEVLIDLSNTAQLDNTPRWLPLREQSESIEHSRAHHATQGPPGPGQGHGQTHSLGQGYMSGLGHGQAPGLGDGTQDSPKNSVIKSRSHGIFPDPAKDMQMLPLEKSHSSPGSSKSSSDGQLRSHGPSRSQSKSSVTQAHLEDAGIAIAAAEAAVQQSRLQPRPGHRLGDVSGSVVLSAPSLVGDAYGDLEGEEGAGTGVDSAIFQVPRIGKTIPNGTDKNQLGGSDNEGGKTQVMGEIKVALKKEVKTEGDQLVLEILQCRNITYKFKSPDHLPDLYVKLYVVNVATQKRIIKKKTRVCRHDREPSFNETFRFPLNPTGHSIQLFLVSNGGKFVKKTLIGEAYIWLDKVDMRKRVVSWHKLFVSSTQTNP